VLRGRAAVEAIYQHWFSAFPDVVFEQHDVLSMDSRAAQVISLQGTDTGGFLGQQSDDLTAVVLRYEA
jgi:SnoaL-like polyketide cyclase